MAFDSLGVGCGVRWYAGRSVGCYLSLDAIEASEPEDLSSAKLPFSVVNLIHVIQLLQLLVWDLLFLGAVSRCFQEF